MTRRGITLLEVLVVTAIIALMAGLLMAAVQKIREAALVTQSQHNLAQIGLAQANYTATLDKLPPVESGTVYERLPGGNISSINPKYLFVELLPYLEQQPLYSLITNQTRLNLQEIDKIRSIRVAVYLNPLDPSTRDQPQFTPITEGFIDITSYAANAQVFEGAAATPAKVTDGLSNTIFLTEHYGWRCGSAEFHYSTYMPSSKRPDGTINPISGLTIDSTRPTFADHLLGDYYPITSGNPPVSKARDNVTFQIKPRVEDCDPRLPNASSSRGLQVLMGDGSVRILPGSIAPTAFWALVSPSGNETITE